MKTPKSAQLRVRLTTAQRTGLNKLLASRGRNESLSDLVRDMVDQLIALEHQVAPLIASNLALRRAALFPTPDRAVLMAALTDSTVALLASGLTATEITTNDHQPPPSAAITP